MGSHVLPPSGTATQPHVDVLLQVDTAVITHVIHPQQRTPVGRHQPGMRNARTPSSPAWRTPMAMRCSIPRATLAAESCRPVERDRLHPGPQLRGERGARLHLHTHPKEIDTRVQLVVRPATQSACPDCQPGRIQSNTTGRPPTSYRHAGSTHRRPGQSDSSPRPAEPPHPRNRVLRQRCHPRASQSDKSSVTPSSTRLSRAGIRK